MKAALHRTRRADRGAPRSAPESPRSRGNRSTESPSSRLDTSSHGPHSPDDSPHEANGSQNGRPLPADSMANAPAIGRPRGARTARCAPQVGPRGAVSGARTGPGAPTRGTTEPPADELRPGDSSPSSRAFQDELDRMDERQRRDQQSLASRIAHLDELIHRTEIDWQNWLQQRTRRDAPTRPSAPSLPPQSPPRAPSDAPDTLPNGDAHVENHGSASASQPAATLGDDPGRRRRGEPALNESRRQLLLRMISLGMSRRRAAACIGCHHATIARTAARDPDFDAQLRAAELVCESDPLAMITKASRKTWRAAAWLLEKTRPQHYGRGAGNAVPCAVARDGLEELAHRLCSLRPHDNELWAEADVAVEQIAAQFAESAAPPSKAKPAVDAVNSGQSVIRAQRETASRVDDPSQGDIHGEIARGVDREMPHPAPLGSSRTAESDAGDPRDSLPQLCVVR